MMKQVNFRIPLRVLTLLMGLMISISAFAQITVNGNVKDATGEPVIGASVRVVGTTIGTTTDFDGNFTLSNVQQGAKLQVSYVGCQTQEVAAAPNVQVTLQDDSQILNEVVVIGYGVAKKKDLTGSVTALKPDTKNKGVVVSAQDMLMGKVAGVSVVSNGGTPGGSATIRIRGGASLNASNDPLIVVDGVPLDNSGVKGFPNGLGMINPQDIESFNVLKDASATAIYGSRGSNGVIIITTKKGKRGQKPSISYNGSVTVNSKRKTIDVLSGDEYRAFVQEAFAGTDREAEALAALGTANTDWQDEITRTTLSQDHNVQLAGSIGSVLPYRLSLGYTNDKGIIKTSDFKRYTVAANLNPSLFNDHLVMNLNAKWMWGKNRYADGGAINNAVRFDPTQPVMAEGFDNFGGYFEWLSSNADMKDAAWPTITNTNAPRNPVAILMLKNDRARSHSFTGSADIDYKVHGFEDLRLHLTLGGDFAGGSQDTDVLPGSPQASYWGSFGWAEGCKENLTLSTYAQYYKDFNEKNHFDIMAGYEWQHFWRKENSEYRNYWPTNSALSTAGQEHLLTLQNDGKGYRTENYLVSFFGRMNYIAFDRYMLTATIRRDGSSRFKEHWATFPAFAFGWKVNEEKFLKNVHWLDELKLRLGYGKTGQQDINNNYAYFASYNENINSTNGRYPLVGVNPSGVMSRPDAYNQDLKWETTTTYNAGLDFSVLRDRIRGSVDYYYRKTTDLINDASVSAGSNFRNQVKSNIGSLENKGIEASLTVRPVQTKDWQVEVTGNFTYNKNEITELTGEAAMIKTGGINAGTGNQCQVHTVGKPANSFYVYQQVYGADGLPLEGVFVDRNNDGNISEEDRYCYKSPAAPYLAGLSARIQYKNWDLGFNLRGSFGNYVFNDRQAGYANVEKRYDSSFAYIQNTTPTAVKNNWKTYSWVLSDYFVENASFVKLDNITLGYSFQNLFKGGSYNGLNGRVYLTATNVATITNYSGQDPEVFGGIDNSIYPRPFSMTLGVNINF